MGWPIKDYSASQRRNGYTYNNKSLSEIFEKNEYVKNIRKQLMKSKIEKSLAKYKKWLLSPFHSNIHVFKIKLGKFPYLNFSFSIIIYISCPLTYYR